jgi:deoxyribodipyrimidine photo-lyase
VNSETHDEIWNAAQTQLREEGIIHNYLRMLWAKKILEWVPNPQLALSYMIDLNDRFALDGRDPNSYSGVFWTLDVTTGHGVLKERSMGKYVT